jgi:hypothetical protein
MTPSAKREAVKKDFLDGVIHVDNGQHIDNKK